jgi:hypothetical protein
VIAINVGPSTHQSILPWGFSGHFSPRRAPRHPRRIPNPSVLEYCRRSPDSLVQDSNRCHINVSDRDHRYASLAISMHFKESPSGKSAFKNPVRNIGNQNIDQRGHNRAGTHKAVGCTWQAFSFGNFFGFPIPLFRKAFFSPGCKSVGGNGPAVCSK